MTKAQTPNSNEKPLRVIISGGGTGGHIYPALAIANKLREIKPETEILFVGAKDRMEMEKIPAEGYQIIGLNISGIQRKMSIKNLLFPYKVLTSIIQSFSILKTFKPHVAVGVGGYASGPLLFAATTKNIPALIQEQNSYAGLTNKWLAGKVQRICVAYTGMEFFFPKNKLLFTGNPVRKDIMQSNDPETKKLAMDFFDLAPNKKTILVIGGSLGARTINESIAANLEKFDRNGIQVIWQTGKGYYNTAQEKVKNISGTGIKLFDFIKQMNLAYAAADIVISRAGALSVSELTLVGKPCILVPSPNVAEDHQTKNAMALVEIEAAILVTDAEAKEKLVEKAMKLLSDENEKQILSHNIKKMARPDAADQIVHEILKLANL